MNTRVICLALICFGAPTLHAQERCEPNLDNFPEPALFRDIYTDAIDLGAYICETRCYGVHGEKLDLAFIEFSERIRQKARGELKALKLDQLDQQLDYFVDLARNGVDENNLPDFSLDPDPLRPGEYTYGFTSSDDFGVFNKTSPECNPDQQVNCFTGLQALADAIAPYKGAYVHCSAAAASEGLAQLTAGWEKYLDESRSQTFLDILVTTLIENDYLSQDHLVGPMKRQWFLLHPGIAVENLGEAVDGNQMELALSVEWFGVNWWDRNHSPLGFAFGVSITSVYSDRAQIDNVGHGLMFHINNQYSVGWASHGGKDSVYVSVDLLNMLGDKKKTWKQYKDRLDGHTAMSR